MKIVSTNKDGTTEEEVQDDVFTWIEGKHWIAAWRHYDIVAQGNTENEAFRKLLSTMGAQCLWDVRDGNLPFANVKKPTPELIAEWERQHALSHASGS